ncbi:MAG: carboxylate-amine ligase [Candidatus Cloacimonetes bacterium 4572_55]|nr:MAG: carboxylate-amine ligase [Candidatus Cloacimonetes bacterium 4572_55]
MLKNPKTRKEDFTLGIEEEFQIINPQTRELSSFITQILADGKMSLREQVKAELHQSVVEIGTKVCRSVHEARQEVTNLRYQLALLAKNRGYRIAASGTHPFSHWVDQKITDHPRYREVVQDMQQIARANLIFGLHVHVGIKDRDVALRILNEARYFIPHIFALSTNSPFWQGRNTGLKSYRTKVFDRFPRTGIPEYFNSLSEYDNFINLLIKTKCIDNAKKIWWDIRLHPFFNTIEYRVCDIMMRVDETIAIAALFQAITAKLYKLIKQNLGFRLYRRALIMENKWRASRYGLDGKMIDFGKREEVSVRSLIHELLEFVDDVVDDLGSRREIEYIYQMLETGSGADRQLSVWRQKGDIKAVVDFIIEETHHGL